MKSNLPQTLRSYTLKGAVGTKQTDNRLHRTSPSSPSGEPTPTQPRFLWGTRSRFDLDSSRRSLHSTSIRGCRRRKAGESPGHFSSPVIATGLRFEVSCFHSAGSKFSTYTGEQRVSSADPRQETEPTGLRQKPALFLCGLRASSCHAAPTRFSQHRVRFHDQVVHTAQVWYNPASATAEHCS